MKKTLVAIAVALPMLATASDINPGALQLSGRSGAGFFANSSKTGNAAKEESTNVNADLSAMYYISKFLGVGLSTTFEKESRDGFPDASTFVFGPKAGLDYELMRHFSLFADGTVGVAQKKIGSATGSGYGLEIAGGFKLFLNQNVSFDVAGVFKTSTADLGGTIGKKTDTMVGGMIGFSLYLTNNPVNADYMR